MPMPILVTGSAGHLGEALMRSLRAAGRAGVGVDRKASPYTDRVGSVCDRSFIERCMRSATAVIHAATLHKPHLATHSWQDFVDTNVTGTLTLLDAARAFGIKTFIYVSTTSAFGSAVSRTSPADAIWVTEDLTPRPRNIYGVTKLMAEDLGELAHRRYGLSVVILRTSRFFPEADDDPEVRRRYDTANAQANEMLYRRVDIEDVVSAIFLALERAADLGFGRYIISATTPFGPADLPMLGNEAPAVVRAMFPDCEALFDSRGWKLFPRIDRVYVNARARADLGWRPRRDFQYVLGCLKSNQDFHSPLARAVGSKGYHDRTFAEGPYPVE